MGKIVVFNEYSAYFNSFFAFWSKILLRDLCIRWHHESRAKQHLQNIQLSDNTEEEWTNLKCLLKQAASESLGFKLQRDKNKYRKLTWDENIIKIINESEKVIYDIYN